MFHPVGRMFGHHRGVQLLEPGVLARSGSSQFYRFTGMWREQVSPSLTAIFSLEMLEIYVARPTEDSGEELTVLP